MNYVQCKLKKITERGLLHTITWLPEKFAKKNKAIRLKGPCGNWEDGWKVVKVFGVSKPEKWILERSQDYKHQREVSDV